MSAAQLSDSAFRQTTIGRLIKNRNSGGQTRRRRRQCLRETLREQISKIEDLAAGGHSKAWHRRDYVQANSIRAGDGIRSIAFAPERTITPESAIPALEPDSGKADSLLSNRVAHGR